MSVLTAEPGAAPAGEEPPETGERHRLTALTGLAALSLDAMASVAYGPGVIVLVPATAGAHGLGFTLPVTLAIAGLLAVLAASYRQVIAAFLTPFTLDGPPLAGAGHRRIQADGGWWFLPMDEPA